MKITLLVATSRDGFINHIGQKHASDWTSPEDKKQYSERLKRYKLQLMGIRTFESYEDRFKTSSQYYRIVFTHEPSNYTNLPGKVEFTDEPIKEVLHRLEAAGFKHASLLGGGVVFTEFLEAGLVDEIYQTVEPLTFGEGIPFLVGGLTMKDFPYLKLESSTPLNNRGTMLLHYVRT